MAFFSTLDYRYRLSLLDRERNDYTAHVEKAYQESPPRAWAEVNLKNLLHNYRQSLQQSGGKIMAVLKAGAYGHGIYQIAEALESLPEDERPAFFGVASAMEARMLSEFGIKTRFYLLGPTAPCEREEIVYRRWTPCLSSLDEAKEFNQLAGKFLDSSSKLSVHITVDTGMGRGGYTLETLQEAWPELLKMEHLQIEGLGSHLPSADEDKAFTHKQFQAFNAIIEKLGASHFKYIHLSNSAGLLGYENDHTNLYRPGLMLYGISTLPEYQKLLKPVMALKSRVTLVRKLPAGHGISYGRDTVLEKETIVATIGVGYGDGYPRSLSNHGIEVMIHGQRCPLLGRVTMDQIMADVSHLPQCKSGDIVELYGENLLVSELAQRAGIVPWEILTGITPRVTRVYA